MSNEQLNTNPQKNNRNKKMFSFNFYWMYGIIFLILMALLMTNGSSGVKEIGWSEFQSLTEQDAFSKILVFNKKNILEASVNKDKTALVFKEENEKNLKDPKVFVKSPSADKFSDCDCRLFFHHLPLPNQVRLHDAVPGAKRIVFVIGPEGGLDDGETEMLSQKGFRSVYLGRNILRCETAPLYAAAAVNIILEECQK